MPQKSPLAGVPWQSAPTERQLRPAKVVETNNAMSVTRIQSGLRRHVGVIRTRQIDLRYACQQLFTASPL